MGAEVHYHNGRIIIRKSMIEDFSICPYKFKKVWLDREIKHANQVMLAGTRFHDFAERFFDYALAVDPDDWEYFIHPDFVPFEVEQLLWFINRERNRYYNLEAQGRLDEFMPVMREAKLQSETYLLESTVDRIDWYDKKKGELSIVEYKTGGKINDHSLTRQLAFYTLIWQDMLEFGKVVNLQLVNPRLGVVKDYPMNERLIDRVLNDIMKLRKAIKEVSFPRKCSEFIYPYCVMCSPDECGIWKESDTVYRFADL